MIIFPHKEVNIFLAVPALDDNDSGERENWWICCLRGDLACHDVHQICQYVSVPGISVPEYRNVTSLTINKN